MAGYHRKLIDGSSSEDDSKFTTPVKAGQQPDAIPCAAAPPDALSAAQARAKKYLQERVEPPEKPEQCQKSAHKHPVRQPSGFKEGDKGMEVTKGEKGEVEVIKELAT